MKYPRTHAVVDRRVLSSNIFSKFQKFTEIKFKSAVDQKITTNEIMACKSEAGRQKLNKG